MLNQIITYWCQLEWLKYFTASTQLRYRFLIRSFFSRRVEYVANIAIYENLCFFCRKMNFPLSQFHVLWIFIIHLCSTISHLPLHSIHILAQGRHKSCSMTLIIRFMYRFYGYWNYATAILLIRGPICSWKFNQLQFVGNMFQFQ